MVEASELTVTWTGTGADLMKLNDGINTKDSVDATATNCYAEVSAKPGYTFQLDSVKIFLTNLLDKAPYTDGNLILQGSNDSGATFTDIHSYDDSIHEGMNSVDWKAPFVAQVYKVIRLQGAIDGSCRIGEVKLIGVEVMDDNNASISCDAEANIDGVVSALISVTYNDAKTPSLSKMGVNPRFGSVLGGETLTLTGQGFAAGVATVKIDERDCAVTSKTDTEIVCTTSDKPYVPGQTPSLDILIAGSGRVATAGQVYRYVSRWSDTETWGGDLPPLEGEAVEIPKGQHLLYDVPSTPTLSFIVVYGSLIFEPNDSDPTDHKYFDAEYIMVNGGYVEVGTEDYPYSSKLTITMHGSESNPYIPTYGNKVLAVRFGQLEMHGMPRSHVWTDLKSTVAAGATSITLNDVNGVTLDWQIGEEIVIASTDYTGKHAEQRKITGVTMRGTNPVITFDEPLEWEHFAMT